jgi:hypothetical protein
VTKNLEKTSVQLAPDMLRDMGKWPGLSRSEAIRLSVERAHYLSTINSEKVSALASRYESILLPALEDFGYGDFRTVARALPAIVAGYLRETTTVVAKDVMGHDLDEGALIQELEGLHLADRIGVLDCVVAQKNRPRETGARKHSASPNKRKPRKSA